MTIEQPPNNPELETDLYSPIPLELPSVAGWKDVPIQENGEPLVALGPFSGNQFDRLFTSSIYFGEREDSPYRRDQLHGALITMFARQESAEQMLRAEQMLPSGMHLIGLDFMRTLDVQDSLYRKFFGDLKAQNPGMDDDSLSTETQKMVSLPSIDPNKPSPHNTGGSLDLAIYKLPDDIESQIENINTQIQQIGDDESQWQEVYRLEMMRLDLIAKNAELLNFGTPFDWGGKEAALNYFEALATQRELTQDEDEARQNRRLLHNVMTNVGFQPYADEWWHYNSAKSQMGARTAGMPYAEYGAAPLTEQNWHHELMRRQHLKGTEILAIKGLKEFAAPTVYLEIAAEAAKGLNTKVTSLPKAAIIAPPEQKAA
jgi:D-alanyl-D-alanine dipeptidase